MAHVEVTVIVAGVLHDSTIFVEGQEELMEAYEEGIQNMAKLFDETVEIYSLYHPHRAHEDCECIQYENDHRPKWSNKE